MTRIIYYFSKVKRAWVDHSLWDKARRFAFRMIREPFEVVIGYLSLSRADRNLAIKDGFAEHRQKNDHHRSDRHHIERIITAYKESKKEQGKAGVAFQIRGLWDEWISINFKSLIASLETEDISALSSLLENFQREQFSIGMGGYDYFQRYHTPLGSLYIRYVWSKYRDILLSQDYDLRLVHSPLIGNPVGICLNGNVVPIETLRHVYHALEMHELLQDVPNAAVVEIGAGLGGQAYQTMQIKNNFISKYVVFDIPETAVISSYYLLSAFPEKRIRLYGEGAVSSADGEEYDLAVWPHFAIAQLETSSVDLFYNSCSFSEMDGACAREYLSIIERTGRGYFLHNNHDVTLEFKDVDGSVSTNVIGSKMIPNPELFRRIYKKPRVHGLPEDRYFTSYEYLYEKRRACI